MINCTSTNLSLTLLLFLFLQTFSIAQTAETKWKITELSGRTSSEGEDTYPLYAPAHQTIYFVRMFEDSYKNRGHNIFALLLDGSNRGLVNSYYPKLNTDDNNAVVGVSDNGDTLYLLGSYDGRNDFEMGLSMTTKLGENRYTNPTQLKIKGFNPKTKYYGLNVHPSGKYLLISMKGKKSVGEEDLYLAFRLDSLTFGNMIHLPATINTEKSEFAPFLSKDGNRLFFTSYGHNGLGDADMYVSYRQSEDYSLWSQAQNLGPGINTEKFEGFLSEAREGQYYFASNRNSEFSHLYFAFDTTAGNQTNLVALNLEAPQSQLNELATLSQAKQDSTQETTKNQTTGEKTTTTNSSRSTLAAGAAGAGAVTSVFFTADAKENNNTEEVAQSDVQAEASSTSTLLPAIGKSEPTESQIDTATTSSELIQHETILSQNTAVKVDSSSSKNNSSEKKDVLLIAAKRDVAPKNADRIYFAFDQSQLDAEHKKELDRIITDFKREGDLSKRIVVAGNSDNLGTVRNNFIKARERGSETRRYLIQNGISARNIRLVIHGANAPIANNNYESGRAKNRRVDLWIEDKN